ncbi:MAG: DUF2252 domain-containing protein [Burkholderiales bacterium]|nr:DUF2252 domain-containing protein [Burkholderiales bacterium]
MSPIRFSFIPSSLSCSAGKLSALFVLAAAALAPLAAGAATARQAYVTQEVYTQNHPYKEQLPQELFTKMDKMALSPFMFFRGTAHLYHKDMRSVSSAFLTSGTSLVWLDGDMHLQNFGAVLNSAGNAVFDTNDFDEGAWGPFNLDVYRLATSIQLAAKEMGVSSADRDSLVRTFAESYSKKMTDFKGSDEELNYGLSSSNTSGVVQDTVNKVAGNTRSSFLGKYTTSASPRRFQTTAELITVSSSTSNAIATAMSSYIGSIPASKLPASASYFNIKDIRLKLGSGTGSLGRYRYWILVEGASSSNSDDVILEMKESVASAVNLSSQNTMPASVYNSHFGYRVVRSLKAQTSYADPLAGYTSMSGKAFFIREKSAFAQDFDYTLLTSYGKWSTAVSYFGKALAKNHALSDKDYDPNLIGSSVDKAVSDAVTGYTSAFKDEVMNFARDYAAQVELDWQEFVKARNAGATLY